jgi:methylenetetrahydrofolate dehydrogenase (NADP+) / methenyltetrahydrofolate cyclohydrolase
MPLLLDGKTCAAALLDSLKVRIEAITDARPPQLTVIQVGDNPASSIYVNRKGKTATSIGMSSDIIRLPEATTTDELLAQISTLNQDDGVDGILVQLPLPPQCDEVQILEAIAPHKDVDGFHPMNVGRLYSGHEPYALPCTPAGMITLLEHYGIHVAGKHAVVLGRSNIVGKPMAQLLLQANATVTLCHSRTQNIHDHLKQADIVVAAIGKPEWITADMLKTGVIVLDVGINRLDSGKLVGDVHFESVSKIAQAITPVPGGVGPMTIATLLSNTLSLYKRKVGK